MPIPEISLRDKASTVQQPAHSFLAPHHQQSTEPAGKVCQDPQRREQECPLRTNPCYHHAAPRQLTNHNLQRKQAASNASLRCTTTSTGSSRHSPTYRYIHARYSSSLITTVLILLEVAAIVGRQSHSSFDREFLHQVHGITRFGLLAIIRSTPHIAAWSATVLATPYCCLVCHRADHPTLLFQPFSPHKCPTGERPAAACRDWVCLFASASGCAIWRTAERLHNELHTTTHSSNTPASGSTPTSSHIIVHWPTA